MKYVFTWENFAWPAGLANSWHRPQQLTPFWCWPVNSPPLFTNPWKGSSYHLYIIAIKIVNGKKKVSLLKILKIYKWDHTVSASRLGEQFGWVLNHDKWAIKPKSSGAMAARGKIRPWSVHSGTTSPADWWLVPTLPWPKHFQVTGLVSPVQ